MYIVTYYYDDTDEQYSGFDVCHTEEDLAKVVAEYSKDKNIGYNVYANFNDIGELSNKIAAKHKEILGQQKRIDKQNREIDKLNNKIEELQTLLNKDLVEENKQLRLKLHNALNTLTSLKAEFKYNIDTIDKQLGKIKNE